MGYVTTATTLLDGIEANLAAVRQRVGPQRQVLAAVKADAYGHGALAVSRMIERAGVADWLGVATVREGAQLRQGGLTMPILKLSHARGRAEVELALRHDLTLPVVDAISIDEVNAAAAARDLVVAVHLKVDTGMRRIGCETVDAPRLAQQIDTAGHLRLEGLFSHLPISDVPAGDDFTREQIERFAGVAREVEAARGPVPLKHLANSGGVLAHPDSWFDLVRPGIMIYGSYPDRGTPPTVELAPAMRFTTRVTFLKQVREGETVGYGRTWTAPRDTWIATIPVGYADGWSRQLSNRGRVLVRGRSRPIAGRVCMDQTMVDVGPDPDVAVGDEVVLIGRDGEEEITVWELADLMGTIPYEVTCLITGRVTRAVDPS